MINSRVEFCTLLIGLIKESYEGEASKLAQGHQDMLSSKRRYLSCILKDMESLGREVEDEGLGRHSR